MSKGPYICEDGVFKELWGKQNTELQGKVSDGSGEAAHSLPSELILKGHLQFSLPLPNHSKLYHIMCYYSYGISFHSPVPKTY